MGKILRFFNMYKASAAAELCSLSGEADLHGVHGGRSESLTWAAWILLQQKYKRYTDEGKHLPGISEDSLPCPLLFEKSKNKWKAGQREKSRAELSAQRSSRPLGFHIRESGMGFIADLSEEMTGKDKEGCWLQSQR